MTKVTRIPDELFPPPPPAPAPAAGNTTTPAIDDTIEAAKLMPYEKVAKAIFVKANGLPAYRLATRFIRYAD